MKNYLLAALLCVIVCGCAGPAGRGSEEAKPVRLEFRLAESLPGPGLTPATVPGRKQPIYLHSEAALTKAHVAAANAKEDKLGPYIEVRFTREGRRILGQVTAAHLGKPIAILLDGQVATAPIVQEAI